MSDLFVCNDLIHVLRYRKVEKVLQVNFFRCHDAIVLLETNQGKKRGPEMPRQRLIHTNRNANPGQRENSAMIKNFFMAVMNPPAGKTAC